MLSLEDLLSGRGRRMILVVRIPSRHPPRLADFTALWFEVSIYWAIELQ